MAQTIFDFWQAYDIEGEEVKLHPAVVNLATAVVALVLEKKNLPLTKERKLEIKIEKPRFALPLVWCDENKIIQVISNLLDNAVFYTLKGGVTISYELVESNGKKYLKTQYSRYRRRYYRGQ